MYVAVTASPSSISPYLNFDPALINVVCINFYSCILYPVSQKTGHSTLTDNFVNIDRFQNSFTTRIGSKFAIS